MTRIVVLLAASVTIAGCGGDKAPSQLADGAAPPAVPVSLSGVDDAVMTRDVALRARAISAERRKACPDLPLDGDRLVVARIGVDGSSLTVADGSSLYACDAIPNPFPDADRTNNAACGSAVGRLQGAVLRDPRLDLCTDAGHRVTAFAWIVPLPEAAWISSRTRGFTQIFRSAGGLPVRVTTSDDVDPEGAATFEIEEYDRDGKRLRVYEYRASVAG